jgi:uncharacterized membrane protein
MRSRKAVCLLLSVCFFAATTTIAFAQDGSPTGNCGFQPLVIPSPAGTTTMPTALNDTGAIVGNLQSGTGAATQNTGFLFSDGKFTHFRFPGSSGTFVNDINKQGVIVGSFFHSPEDIAFSFMVHNGVFTKIELPGFSNTPNAALSINGLGDIVGQLAGSGSANIGYLLHQGELTIISFPGAVGGTFPTGINDQGIVVGSYKLVKDGPPHGFMWLNGAFTNIALPGAAGTVPVKISNSGDVVGTWIDQVENSHGLAFDKGDFFFIDRPGFNATQLIAVNSFDNVLGFVSTATGRAWFKGFCSAVF